MASSLPLLFLLIVVWYFGLWSARDLSNHTNSKSPRDSWTSCTAVHCRGLAKHFCRCTHYDSILGLFAYRVYSLECIILDDRSDPVNIFELSIIATWTSSWLDDGASGTLGIPTMLTVSMFIGVLYADRRRRPHSGMVAEEIYAWTSENLWNIYS